jgi:hypothetical protein
MQQHAVETLRKGDHAQVAALEARVEFKIADRRDRGRGFIHIENEVIFAEGLEAIDGEDVEGVGGGATVKIKPIIDDVFLLEVVENGGSQWHKPTLARLGAGVVGNGRDTGGKVSGRS